MNSTFRFLPFVIGILLSIQIANCQPECATCKLSPNSYPYMVCQGGHIRSLCTNDPWGTAGITPLRRQIPPCYYIKDYYRSDISVDRMDSVWETTSYDSSYTDPDTGDDTTVTVTDSSMAGVYTTTTVFDDFLVSGDLDSGSLNPWLTLCGDGSTYDFNHCCAAIHISINPRDFSLFSFADKDTDWAGATDGMRYDSSTCSIVCDTSTNYIALNLTNAFLYEGNPNLTIVPYSGSYLPNVINADGTHVTKVMSVRTTMTHEWGHWLGYPVESWQTGLPCLPDTIDIMFGGVDTNKLDQPPLGLSDWDMCWFKLLYCCDNTEAVKYSEAPNNLLLLSNAPNPFSNRTVVTFTVAGQRHVMLNVFDAKGALVKVLENGLVDGGTHSIIFDGSGLPVGVYHYILFD